jgi:bacterioferritin
MDQATNDAIIKELTHAYWLEMETTINYLAISVDLDGIRAEEIKKSLAEDIQIEITHAQELAARIKEIDGRVPGSFAFKPEQASLQPPADPTDLVSTIHGVIEAENVAINQYNKIIRMCDGIDYVTQDLCIKLLADEEKHRREFRGFLKEFEND